MLVARVFALQALGRNLRPHEWSRRLPAAEPENNPVVSAIAFVARFTNRRSVMIPPISSDTDFLLLLTSVCPAGGGFEATDRSQS